MSARAVQRAESHLPLVGPRLRIERWRSADAPALAALGNDPGIARMMTSIPHPFTEADAARRIARAGDGSTPAFVAAIREGEVPVGECGLFGAEGESASILYWLCAAHRGRGLAEEAVRLLLPLAFGAFGIRRLIAEYYDDNPASAHLLGKLGFVVTGGGDDPDHPLRPEGARFVTAELTAERWEETHG